MKRAREPTVFVEATLLALRALAAWLVILACAFANGLLREAILVPRLGATAANFTSGMLLSVLILIVAYASLPLLAAKRRTQFVGIGLGWFALTLVFEFSFGWLQGRSWPAMLEAYTFRDGDIWPLVLLATLAAPSIAARSRGFGQSPKPERPSPRSLGRAD